MIFTSINDLKAYPSRQRGSNLAVPKNSVLLSVTQSKDGTPNGQIRAYFNDSTIWEGETNIPKSIKVCIDDRGLIFFVPVPDNAGAKVHLAAKKIYVNFTDKKIAQKLLDEGHSTSVYGIETEIPGAININLNKRRD